MEQKYKTLDMKISRSVHTQTQKPSTNTKFYPRVTNKTSISFTDEELTLLSTGLKYNLNHKRKYWLSYLALEAESTILWLHTSKTISDTRERITFKIVQTNTMENT
jgi:hypothetical protein